MKKILSVMLAIAVIFSMTACSSTTPTETVEPTESASTTTEFSAEYEMEGTTSAGVAKSDTFIFEGTTDENGIIKTLNFDIIRNKGTEDEYSKKDIYGYEMNVADFTVEEVDGAFNLTQLSSSGWIVYDETAGGVQYWVNATCEGITPETTFGDLTVTNFGGGEELSPENALKSYQYLADEIGIELSADTKLIDIADAFGLVQDGNFVAGTKRLSYAGFNGGRSYGEQIDAIVDYILANNMTLEDVYNMFKTENQQTTPIEDRDLISGATITFVGDFQRTVYLAMHGELFQGVVNQSTTDGMTTMEVVTQGYAGEIETHVTFDDATGKIVSVAVRDDSETPELGGVLTAEGSEFLTALVEYQDDLENTDLVSMSTSTFTVNALIDAVKYAIEAYNAQ